MDFERMIWQGREVYYRPDTADVGTMQDVSIGYHRPPFTFIPKTILDLGAHAGYAALDLLNLYPQSSICAVEPDFDNYQMLHMNLGPSNRARTVRAAISSFSGMGEMSGDANNAKKLVPYGSGVYIYPIAHILNLMGWDKVDYVKMDIEGEERNVLTYDGTWQHRVECLKVELHDGFTTDEAMGLLSPHFPLVYADPLHPFCVVAERR